MHCFDDYKNTSYTLGTMHLINGVMNDTKENPIVLAFNDAFQGRFYFECDEEFLYVARTEKMFDDGEFDKIYLSFKMREFMRHFNQDQKVLTSVICVCIVEGTDRWLLYMFEENWKSIYNNW